MKKSLVKNHDWTCSSESILKHWIKASKESNRNTKVFSILNWPDRLNRLFAVACCYEILPLIRDESSRNAIMLSEAYSDGGVTAEELKASYATATAVATAAANAAADAAAATYAAANATAAAANAAANAATNATNAANAAAVATAAAAAAAANAAAATNTVNTIQRQGLILVQMIGPGWIYNSSWATDTAVLLAKNMYSSRDFSAMPILADALQDADCNAEELLKTMRDTTQPWYRGCRILDELLRKR